MADEAVVASAKPPRELWPYYRHVAPEGKINHHGDCAVFVHDICTCGLLHMLLPMQDAKQYYKNFWEECGLQAHAFDRMALAKEA